jgi:hypothetical protein
VEATLRANLTGTLLTGCTLGGIMLTGCGGESGSSGSGGDGDEFGMEDLTAPSGFELTEGLIVDPQSVPGSDGGYKVIYNADGANIQLPTYVFPSEEGANEYFDFVFGGPAAVEPPSPAIGDEAYSIIDESIPHVLLIGFRRNNVIGSMQLAASAASGGLERLESDALAVIRELDARVKEGLRN